MILALAALFALSSTADAATLHCLASAAAPAAAMDAMAADHCDEMAAHGGDMGGDMGGATPDQQDDPMSTDGLCCCPALASVFLASSPSPVRALPRMSPRVRFPDDQALGALSALEPPPPRI